MSTNPEIMFLGSECNHPACYLHDFLPFSCPACHQSFCQPHFLPSQHSCTAPLPPSMVDRIAPTCPMCSEIVPFPKSMDPNEAVEQHILGGTCTGFQGGEERKKAEVKRRRDAGEVCWRKTCGKVLVVKMKCDTCQHMFCPTHRRPNAHSCTNQTPSPGSSSSGLVTPQLHVPNPSRPAGKSAMSRLLPPSMQPPAGASAKPSLPAKTAPSPKPLPATVVQNSEPATTGGTGQKMDARAAAAAAALKRAGQDVKVPFVKSTTQKRTKAEIDSQMKALKARHDKGLLTKAEQVKYAELVGEKEASRRSGGNGEKGKDKDCIIA
ncbi:hypothetical protein L198_03767 [Cryptococcus wingfieldii CBS 7118]|uniref:AN1-type domain-containing protein n=1 Tax=Cryptococcus wingfieldii CBS 7118 TaxID=1295528 RepID=A0A1E3JF41_9TREE|nr:hypothetical protein L198_03767 [Cryptococcus wingfieldii CBS 7118]ODN98521.1 hypothetical protein L198_03767 [Cryptococcus wingfieldii CBS 7118]